MSLLLHTKAILSRVLHISFTHQNCDLFAARPQDITLSDTGDELSLAPSLAIDMFGEDELSVGSHLCVRGQTSCLLKKILVVWTL